MNRDNSEATGDMQERAPCFAVGQDREGHWLAVETHGRGGGIFVSREAAWHYAWIEAGRRPDTVIAVSGPLALG